MLRFQIVIMISNRRFTIFNLYRRNFVRYLWIFLFHIMIRSMAQVSLLIFDRSYLFIPEIHTLKSNLTLTRLSKLLIMLLEDIITNFQLNILISMLVWIKSLFVSQYILEILFYFLLFLLI